MLAAWQREADQHAEYAMCTTCGLQSVLWRKLDMEGGKVHFHTVSSPISLHRPRRGVFRIQRKCDGTARRVHFSAVGGRVFHAGLQETMDQLERQYPKLRHVAYYQFGLGKPT